VNGYPFTYVHKACGHVAFFATERLKGGMVLTSKMACLPDGSKPTGVVVCGSCGQAMSGPDVEVFFEGALV